MYHIVKQEAFYTDFTRLDKDKTDRHKAKMLAIDPNDASFRNGTHKSF